MAEGAYQHALAYARDRKQGPTPKGATAIIDHPDISPPTGHYAGRDIRGARDSDGQLRSDRYGDRDRWRRLGRARRLADADHQSYMAPKPGLPCPTWASRFMVAWVLSRKRGAAQFLRDVRVTSIYEGTNAIQALDLVGRKLSDGGAAGFCGVG